MTIVRALALVLALWGCLSSAKSYLYPNGLTEGGIHLSNYISSQQVFYSQGNSVAISQCQSNANACDNNAFTAYQISYPDSNTQHAVCICNSNPVMDFGYMAFQFSIVPAPIRNTVIAITAASAGHGGGAATGGGKSTYYEANMAAEVFVHESTHAFDAATKSFTSGWTSAINGDSCWPDPYSSTSPQEDYAQTMVVWIWMVATGQQGSANFNCVRNQVNYAQSTLPASSIRCATYTVKSGDSLSTIAASYNNRFTWQTLCSFNGLDANCNALTVGQLLTVPC